MTSECPPTDAVIVDPPDPALRQHLEGCAACRNRRALFASLDSGGQDVALPEELQLRLLEMLDATWATPLEGSSLAIEDRQWLGAGERGPTFSVFDRALQRRVALKQLHGVDLARVRAVQAAVDEVGHPGLLGWLDIRPREDGGVVLTRALVHGTSFDQALERATRHRALQLVSRVVSALWALHRCGFAHGGLSPTNILLEPHGRLVVVDAGLGGLPERSPWRAPELGPGEASPSGDWYALARMVERWAPQLLGGDRTSFSVASVLYRMLDQDHAARPGSEAALAAFALEQGFGASEPARYELRERLDKGGMGELFRAWDPILRREVALKCLARGPASLLHIQRFLAEARVAAQLEHPNIVAVHDLGWMDDGAPYFVMKLIQGRELGKVIDEEHAAGSVRLVQVIEALARLCDAVAYAHSRGVIHCDLKPRNVLIGAYQDVQLIDWGAARFVRDSMPSIDLGEDGAGVDRVAGTRGYMAPEQAEARTEQMGPHSDVFALGRVLFQALTGQAPSPDGPCPPVRTVAPRTPPELASIADKTQRPRPSDRYAGAEALGADLRAWLAGERVSAHRYGVLDDLERRTRGRRVALVLGLLGTLVVGTALWFAVLGFHSSNLAAARDLERQGLVKAEQARLAWIAGERVDAERLAAESVALADTPEGRGLLVRLGRVWYPRVADLPAERPPPAATGCPGHPVARIGQDIVYPGIGLFEDKLSRGVTSDPLCDRSGLRLAFSRGDEVDVWKLAPLEEDAILEGHVGGVRTMAWSHDGRTLATADGLGLVRLWDAPRARELARLPGHGAVTQLTFADRSGLLVVEGERTRAWDLRPPGGPDHVENVVPITSVSWSGPLATVDQHHRWREWDPHTGRFSGREVEGVLAAALSPDGRVLAVVGGDGSLRIGEVLADTRASAVTWIGREVVSGGPDGVLRRFGPDGSPRGQSGGGEAITSVQAVRAEPLVVRRGGRVELGGLSWPGVTATGVSAGAVVLALGEEGEVRIVDPVLPRQRLVATLDRSVAALAVTTAGDAIALLGADHTVRIYHDTGRGWVERARTVVDVRSPPGLAFSPDGQVLAVIGLGGTLELWDASVLAPPGAELVARIEARYGGGS